MNGYKTWMAVAAAMLLLGGVMPALADTTETSADERIATEASVTAGYRGVSSDDNPGRAREYDSLESSPLFNVKLFTDRGSYHLDLNFDYLNEDDYTAEAHLDTKGLLRLDLRSQRFFHNLDHIPYDNDSFGTPEAWITPLPGGTTLRNEIPNSGVPGSRPDAYLSAPSLDVLRAYYDDQNPGKDYGLRLDLNEAKLEIKCPDYPAHINLAYWRYEKKGDKQLRFFSEGGIEGSFDPEPAVNTISTNCVGCHMQSKTRNIDRVTEEVKVSADAHAGFVDVVLEGLYRTFHDREDIPTDYFGAHGRGRNSGDYEHDEDPDSQVKEATLRLNTAPSGGLVGSASFTIGERKNRSDLDSVGPVDAETDYTKTAADVTYTPSQNWTFNFRYRLLDLDSENTDEISSYGSVRGTSDTTTDPFGLEVREAMDITRAWYEALVNYRPTPRMTLKAEFRREEIDRSNTGVEGHAFHSPNALLGPEAITGIVIDESWPLPDEEVITRVKLGLTSRLLEKSALKLSGWVAVQKNDNPAYGTSFEDSQELFLAASYNPSPVWGFLANINLLKQKNNDHVIQGFETEPATYEFVETFDLEREKEQQNFSMGSWLAPRDGLTFDLNYGYMRTAINQDLLFGKVVNPELASNRTYAIEDEGVDYRQTVQTVTLGATWQILDNLSCRLEGSHIRSKAYYKPDFATQYNQYTYTTYNAAHTSSSTNYDESASSSDLHEISKVDIRQNGLRGRVNWQVDENWGCAVEATYDNYDEIGNDIYDGSVQTAMVSFSRSW